MSVINREGVIAAVKSIVLGQLQDCQADVYLFGSWARGEEKSTSDVDIAISFHKEEPPGRISHIRDMLEESTIPFRVDVVDMNTADEKFLENVRKEGIPWVDCQKGWK